MNAIAPNSTLISAEYKEKDGGIKVEATFRMTAILAPENVRQMQNLLELKLGKPVAINADVVIIRKVNDKESFDSSRQLLPNIQENETGEVEKTTTPEEIIASAIREKIFLLPSAQLEDFTLDYRNSTATYIASINFSGTPPINEKFSKAIHDRLEDRLKRRVEVKINFKTAVLPVVIP